ncbi:ABC transporter ATP-binding protein [Phreatobacter stygius]|uniref:ABC transporter ATP-binding protein n=1 Tax=Phreatobacter stygius TaxID=1940610 RepID=A0A4D7BC72_9HYPH|nr:ABC transporter ATP-binding protein [Phreatobacter stygius]QCI67648.1 ABC transporter ATP-binding protein [Phreatobacter stygius]
MTDPDAAVTAAPVLAITGLRKAFGALVATDDVTLDVRPGELHALIGPNGAGKSTLITQICGELAADAGRIRFDGRDITTLPAHARARLGLGRSFQLTQLCPDFSALENVLLSIEARHGGSFDMLSNPRRNGANRQAARDWLDRVGLADREDRRVATLGHGERRQLEIAVALARQPRLLLLDEPMAGMGPEESAALTRLLGSLKRHYAILLVEHDMDAVFALADRVSVLVYGRIIFTGTVDAVRDHPDVRAAYLGEEPAC